jgi:hypothetical protein
VSVAVCIGVRVAVRVAVRVSGGVVMRRGFGAEEVRGFVQTDERTAQRPASR